MEYRIYLLGSDGHISAAEGLVAASDEEARQTAADAYQLAADTFRGYELWRGAIFISGAIEGVDHSPPSADRLSDARHRRLLELEDRLAQTFEAIRTSRDLMEKIDALRQSSGAEFGSRGCYGPGGE